MNYYRILEPDELMHYGVKGMKWGKRKAYQTAYTNEAGKTKFVTNAEGKVIPMARQTNVSGQGKGLYRRGTGVYENPERVKSNLSASGQDVTENNRNKKLDYYRYNVKTISRITNEKGKDWEARDRMNAAVAANRRKVTNLQNAAAKASSSSSSSSSSTKKKKVTGGAKRIAVTK